MAEWIGAAKPLLDEPREEGRGRVAILPSLWWPALPPDARNEEDGQHNSAVLARGRAQVSEALPLVPLEEGALF